ncbi:hypothetical protein D3C76_1720260 [compost metagenome]
MFAEALPMSWSWNMSRSTVEVEGPMTFSTALAAGSTQGAGAQAMATFWFRLSRRVSSCCSGVEPSASCFSQNTIVRSGGADLPSSASGGSKGLDTNTS